jgi:hypothetical protein
VNYHEYITSPEWRAKADYLKSLAGWRCQVCNSADEPLHAHHRTYERLGHEDPNDITILCETCHSLFHDKMARSEVAMAMLDELPEALERWGIPTWPNEGWIYTPEEGVNPWDYYSHGKELIALGSAWLGHGRNSADGNSRFYDKALQILMDYLRPDFIRDDDGEEA